MWIPRYRSLKTVRVETTRIVRIVPARFIGGETNDFWVGDGAVVGKPNRYKIDFPRLGIIIIVLHWISQAGLAFLLLFVVPTLYSVSLDN